MTLILATVDGLEPMGGNPDALATGVVADPDLLVHRIRLAESAPARRRAEVLMKATDLAARPVEDLHLALGPVDEDGSAWLAILDRAAMESHRAHFLAHGAEPTRLVPAPLLLAPGADGVAVARLGDTILLRTDALAATAEPALAAALGAPTALPPPFSQSVAPALAADAPNLLQGAFAPLLRWWRLRWVQVASVLLAAAALLLAFLPAILASRQQSAVIDAEDAKTVAAASALPTPPNTAAEAAAALAAARRAREAGKIGPRLTHAVQTLAGVPGARLDGLALDAAGDRLVLRLGGGAPAVNAARDRLLAGAFQATGAGTEVVLGDRRGLTLSGSAAAAAVARRLEAERDAAVLRAPAPPRPVPGTAATVLAAAGLDPTMPRDADGLIALPAVRPAVLLPLIADAEARGLRLRALSVSSNPDRTIAVRIGLAP
jgi:type II secretion system protein L